jgi:hypothetical protein
VLEVAINSLVFFVILYYFIFRLNKNEKAISEFNKQVGKSLQITYRPKTIFFYPKHKLTGTIADIELEISVATYDLGKPSSETHTRVKLHNQEQTPKFIIKKKDFFTKLT